MITTALMLITAEDASPVGINLSTAQIIIGVMSTLGVGSVLAAIVNGLWTRKKLGADATEIITKAASGVVENISADNVRLRAELDEERQARRADKRESDRERAEFRRVIALHTTALQEHAAWDHLMSERAAQAGWTDIPPPPALYAEESSPSILKEMVEKNG